MRNKIEPHFYFVFAVFVGLFIIGAVTGSLFSEDEAVRSLGSLVSEKIPFQGDNKDDWFSVLFFEKVFYLLPIFLFGATYLGILITPCVMFLIGTVYGINFTVLFHSLGASEYVRYCLVSIPSILGTVIIVVFAVHAFYLSVLLCRQFCRPDSFVQNMKKYGLHFIFTFVFEALISGFYLLITAFAVNLI